MELLLDKEHLKYYNQDIYAKTAISVLYDIIKNSESAPFDKIFKTKDDLLCQHPYNIVLKNAIDFFLWNLPSNSIKEAAKEKYVELLKKITEINEKAAETAAKKIKNNSTVFVHSLNNQVFGMLAQAAKNKSFKVNILEHSPFSFGKHLSKKLKESRITATVFPDIAINQAVSSSDTCFFGGEAVLSDKNAIAKIGSVAALEISKKHNIPSYVCIHSMKYDHKKRMQASLTHQYSGEYGHDLRNVYEHIPKESVGAFICEFGVFKPEQILEEFRFYNRWMFI